MNARTEGPGRGRARRLAWAATVCAAFLLCSAAAALAATVTGTDRGEVLIGTEYADSITDEGGRDVVQGLAGDDEISSGRGRDRIYGGEGDDFVRVQDPRPRRPGTVDVVNCGPGLDTVEANNRDRFRNCEMRVEGFPYGPRDAP